MFQKTSCWLTWLFCSLILSNNWLAYFICSYKNFHLIYPLWMMCLWFQMYPCPVWFVGTFKYLIRPQIFISTWLYKNVLVFQLMHECFCMTLAFLSCDLVEQGLGLAALIFFFFCPKIMMGGVKPCACNVILL